MLNNKNRGFDLVYEFDQAVPNWQERLASAYGMIFDKIKQMEMEKKSKEIERMESYGTTTV